MGKKDLLQVERRPWVVLNYAVSEPNEWTSRAIAEDLGVAPKKISTAALSLEKRGLIVKGPKIGQAHTLFPTPDGVAALYEAI